MAKDAAPSVEKILGSLGASLNKYLSNVNIKNRRDISIDKSSFLPIVRAKNYWDITSGGLRTIVSIGHFLSILQYSVLNDVNFPGFLMVDTVGKYLGKTNEKYLGDTDRGEDAAENISDPEMYKNMYEHMIALAALAEENKRPCQIVLVDNDVPPSIKEEYSGFIIAHFSSGGENGLQKGLIDDWEQLSPALEIVDIPPVRVGQNDAGTGE
jgi:hypothetical protein